MGDPDTPLAFPDDREPERPSAARMYDTLLGGFNNYAVDLSWPRSRAQQCDAALA